MYPRIRGLREDADLKQRELAELLHLHQTTYSDYELGRLNMPAPVLIQLAQFYHTSVDYILGLTNQTEPYPRPQEDKLGGGGGAETGLPVAREWGREKKI